MLVVPLLTALTDARSSWARSRTIRGGQRATRVELRHRQHLRRRNLSLAVIARGCDDVFEGNTGRRSPSNEPTASPILNSAKRDDRERQVRRRDPAAAITAARRG